MADERGRDRAWPTAPARRAIRFACLFAIGCQPPSPPPSQLPQEPQAAPLRAPLIENADGIIGGPVDETAFDYDPEPEAGADVELVLDGVPDPEPETSDGLEPYLAVRRATLAGLGPGGRGIVVLSRMAQVTQAYFVAEPGARPRPITHSIWPISQASFLPGRSDRLVYRSDTAGSEDHQLFVLDDQGTVQRLTDGRSRHGPFRVRSDGILAYTGNPRSPADMDLYVRNVERSRPRRVRQAQGQHAVLGWSPDGSQVLMREFRSVDDTVISLVDVASGRAEPLVGSGVDGDSACVDARFGRGGMLYVVCDRGGESLRLFAVRDGTWTPLSPDRPWDVETLAISPGRTTLAFTINDDGESILYTVGTSDEVVTRYVDLPGGVISRVVFASGTTILFSFSGPRVPGDIFAYDIATGELVRWTGSATGGLAADAFELPELHRVAAPDDLSIPTYVYRADGPGPHPALLWIHGGPEEQSRPSFNPMIQYFVDSGITVVAPNIRGSDGYGRIYRSLDNGLQRDAAIEDVGAVLDWIAGDPGLDGRRVGIHGASYGGYVALAALAEYGSRITAGSDVVGIANFVTLLENTREYRRPLRRREYGDERDPAIREYLQRVSPLSRADRITSPLLVAHGANDPRVPLTEAEAIVRAVRAHDTPVWFAVAPDEGHSFRKQSTRDDFYRILATFFRRHLLDAEPAGEGDAPAPEATTAPEQSE